VYCMMIDVLQWLFRVAGIRGKSRERGSSAGGRESEAQEAVQRGTVPHKTLLHALYGIIISALQLTTQRLLHHATLQLKQEVAALVLPTKSSLRRTSSTQF
jgi:hypothetical protein